MEIAEFLHASNIGGQLKRSTIGEGPLSLDIQRSWPSRSHQNSHEEQQTAEVDLYVTRPPWALATQKKVLEVPKNVTQNMVAPNTLNGVNRTIMEAT